MRVISYQSNVSNKIGKETEDNEKGYYNQILADFFIMYGKVEKNT